MISFPLEKTVGNPCSYSFLPKNLGLVGGFSVSHGKQKTKHLKYLKNWIKFVYFIPRLLKQSQLVAEIFVRSKTTYMQLPLFLSLSTAQHISCLFWEATALFKIAKQMTLQEQVGERKVLSL